MTLDVADEAQGHPGPRLPLDPDDLGLEMKRLLAGKIEVELGSRTRFDLPGGPHEQAAAGDVLHKAINNQPIGAKLRAGPDRDSYGCPLVHVW